MEAGQEISDGGFSLKRQRTPLLDNLFYPSEVNDSQKRPRLEVMGRENRSPRASSSGRGAEVMIKPDTPIVPSVRSRVQQLAERRDVVTPLTQRCLSDPGDDITTLLSKGKFCHDHLLSEEDFHKRMERFKGPFSEAGPDATPSPSKPPSRNLSELVSGIQQKLQGDATPSSKQASRIRQEREQEMNQLHLQPIKANAWLKRSSSDPLLCQERTPSTFSTPSWTPRIKRVVQWPPMRPWDLDAEMKDGSFSETIMSGAQNSSLTVCTTKVPAASVEVKALNEIQLPTEWKKHNTGHVDLETPKEEKGKRVVENEAQPHSDRPREWTVVQLSFSEDPIFFKVPCVDDHKKLELPADEEQILLESTRVESSMAEEEDIECRLSSNEETMEISTEEEARLWRYPTCSGGEPTMTSCHSSRENSNSKNEVAQHTDCSQIQDGERLMVSFVRVSASPSVHNGSPLREKQILCQPKSCLEDLELDKNISIVFKGDKREASSCKKDDAATITGNIYYDDMKETEQFPYEANGYQPPNYNLMVCAKEDMDQVSDEKGGVVANLNSHTTQSSETLKETEHIVVDGCQTTVGSDRPVDNSKCAVEGEHAKKVTFILDSELINSSTSSEASIGSVSDVEPSYHDETNTAEIIDQMFDEVLEYAERIEEKRSNDEGTLGRGIAEKEDVVIESEQGKNNQINGKKEECDEIKKLEANGDELLFPPTGILSPLSKSVEAAVTPLRLEATKEEYSPSLPLTPEETPLSPLYSIDAYRTQRQSEMPTIQSVTPGLQRKLPEKPQPQSSTNTKEKIAMLNEEVAKLQIVINQTLQALSCCTDEEHGQGSLEEAEAEKLLLVSCEKRSAVLDEVARLREERCLDSSGEEHVMQQPCRGTVNISNIQLPLKVEFVCSSHNHAGRPSHYFFILIRYGAYNIVATPLATAATAQNGDTISFPTSITLKDIRSTFEIDVEVYSLSHTSVINSGIDRITTKSRVTPRKLLNTITKASNSLTAAAIPALNIRRSSNFTLVGSHKITLSSLGHSKFSLDKMKLEGKIRKLLGDEFQEKVPFLSPLEGNIYLQLHSESHSRVQHHGFLTMFELISGLGVWHRRYFTLDGCSLRYWNHPNDKDSKEAEGVLSLSSSPSQCVRPVKKGSCARPFTFELVSAVPQDDSQESLTKCWFSADTNQEKLDWMEKLKQALLDFNTWNSTSAQTQQSSNSSVNLRESIL
ncbi:anillin, actin binding protein 2 isoform X2 [Nerophis lumbriciformis]|uniref:anillin, actin binding protein 2 isoform X2 n=1 Tax=Nerophis lumbriciformis TaxID=546530 RepID=UPI002ADF415A|nr:anillin, actin binding protein 2 isoform X2 [Nerophis lumbriciformis]